MAAPTSRIATTNDGFHVLGATTAAFMDLGIGTPNAPNIINATGLPTGPCPLADLTPQNFTTSPVFSGALPGVTATAITGVFPTSDSKTAFVTYTGTGGVVPAYTPALPQPSATPNAPPTVGPGTLASIPLSTALGAPIAPVAGVVSADNQTFFAGTTGDNAVHLITKQTDGSYKDVTTPIAPKLPDTSGNIVAPNLLVQKPRKSTN
jgi:hypothetical protein